MAEWLSFWNAETRRRNEADLRGHVVSPIYVPFGMDHLKRGDTIYCFGIEDGTLYLITRLIVGTLDEDPEHQESLLVEGAEDDEVEADYDRAVPEEVIGAVRYLHANGSEHRLIDAMADGWLDGSHFQGRASLRELSAGGNELEGLLS